MPASSRAEAQRHADEIRSFERELERLRTGGVLGLGEAQQRAVADYHARLLARYAREFDIDRDVQAKQLSLGMRIASLLGALALAASVFFLFYQYWGLFSATAQVAILLAASLGSFAATMWIRSREGSGYFTKLAAMLSFACFVLNVSLLGQIFDITPSDTAFVAWAALAFLLAYSCDLRLLLGAGIVCVVAFIAARTGTVSGIYWLYFGERPENFFPAAVVLFAVPAFVGHQRFASFDAVYRVFAMLTLLLPILVLANWGNLSYFDFDPTLIKYGYQVLGFAGSAAMTWYGVRRGWVHVVNTGVVFLLVFLYTKFFDWWWEYMPKYVFFLVLGLTAVLFLVV
ncbi:MAG TPA: DUF2157 domain-containing protein, partial [Burkholderiales bacterium]|nr:DUF2157 domain-containing protein [Burkholderiales bacterium]